MTTEPARGMAMRQRILDAVRRYPGIHLRELARQLNSSVALVEYHTPTLEADGWLSVRTNDSYTRLYPNGDAAVDPKDEAWIALLRQPNPVHIVLALMDEGPSRHGPLATKLAMGKSKLSFHLRKLEAAGMVVNDQGALTLQDPDRTSRLLLAHPPIQDLTDRFASFWNAFYGNR